MITHTPTGKSVRQILARESGRSFCDFGDASNPFTWVNDNELRFDAAERPEGHLDDAAIIRAIVEPTQECYLSGVALAAIIDALSKRMAADAEKHFGDDEGGDSVSRIAHDDLCECSRALDEASGVYNDLLW